LLLITRRRALPCLNVANMAGAAISKNGEISGKNADIPSI